MAPPGLKALALLAGLPASGQADLAYVTCQPDDALSVIDTVTGQELSRWPLPGKPAGVAAHGGSVFTISPDTKSVRRFSSDGRLLAEITLEGGPLGAAFDHRRNQLYVSDWYNARIWVLRATTLELLLELETGAAPAGLALSADGRYLASADKDADQVSLFDAHRLELVARIPVGTRPFGLRFDPEGRLFVGNVGSNDVTVLHPDGLRHIATIPVGERPYGIAFAQAKAFVSDQYDNTVTVIDLASLEPVAQIGVGEYPEGIDASADGSHIVLANWFDNTVTILDAITHKVLYDIPTCDGPRAFGRFLLGGEEQ
ncbi:MAG: YncE family protein [Pseudomonadota bacterium]